MKFVLGTSGDIKFEILVEDSNTAGPRLITVRLGYLVCNSDVVNLVWESNEWEAGIIIVNFCYLGSFDRLWVRVYGVGQKASVNMSKMLLYNPSVRRFSSELLRAIISY